eukprot:1758007-Rhodomonas_salina.1
MVEDDIALIEDVVEYRVLHRIHKPLLETLEVQRQAMLRRHHQHSAHMLAGRQTCRHSAHPICVELHVAVEGHEVEAPANQTRAQVALHVLLRLRQQRREEVCSDNGAPRPGQPQPEHGKDHSRFAFSHVLHDLVLPQPDLDAPLHLQDQPLGVICGGPEASCLQLLHKRRAAALWILQPKLRVCEGAPQPVFHRAPLEPHERGAEDEGSGLLVQQRVELLHQPFIARELGYVSHP